MNRKQIIAELRRIALKNGSPWDLEPSVFLDLLWVWQELRETMLGAKHDHMRTFYLLVACALEDEQ